MEYVILSYSESIIKFGLDVLFIVVALYERVAVVIPSIELKYNVHLVPLVVKGAMLKLLVSLS